MYSVRDDGVFKQPPANTCIYTGILRLETIQDKRFITLNLQSVSSPHLTEFTNPPKNTALSHHAEQKKQYRSSFYPNCRQILHTDLHSFPDELVERMW